VFIKSTPGLGRYCRGLTGPACWILLILAVLLPVGQVWAGSTPAQESEALGILTRMEASYAKVSAYQTEMEVREYRKGKHLETKRFLYTFKKPNQLRIDMRSPQPGTVLVYPDKQGKVTLRPGGWTGFVTLHLAPDNSMLATESGARIDQSDFGLLLRNIRHSLTDQRRGEITLSEAEGRISIEVLADDHFLPGVQTLYRFVFDSARGLPLEEQEATPKGVPKRVTIFGKLKSSITIREDFFAVKG
jgi:outer membrane lipoprotein-sorting protein